MGKQVVYISGKMSGLPEYNRPAFMDAERRLKELDFVVLNPAWNPEGLDYENYMDIAFAMVRASDILVTLPGFEDSRGARAEVAYAECLGILVSPLATLEGN